MLSPMSKALVKCQGTADINLYKIYAELSSEIHGAPWSGPFLRVASQHMSKQAHNVIRCLADAMFIGVVED